MPSKNAFLPLRFDLNRTVIVARSNHDAKLRNSLVPSVRICFLSNRFLNNLATSDLLPALNDLITLYASIPGDSVIRVMISLSTL